MKIGGNSDRKQNWPQENSNYNNNIKFYGTGPRLSAGVYDIQSVHV